MAYPTARPRDPLLDDGMQAMLERRGREILGLCLMGLCIVLALAMGSYVPDDPSWYAASTAPAQNILGKFGASISAPLFIVIGYGVWGIIVALAVWSVRLILHRGAELFLSRAPFAPLLAVVLSIHSATLVPSSDWSLTFGLGGLLGDTALKWILQISPIGVVLTIKLVTVLTAVLLVVLALFILGVSRHEFAKARIFLTEGLLSLRAGVPAMTGAVGAVAAAGAGVRAKASGFSLGGLAQRGDDEPLPWEVSAPVQPQMQQEPLVQTAFVQPNRPERAPIFVPEMPRNQPQPAQMMPHAQPVQEPQPEAPARPSLLQRVAQRRKFLEKSEAPMAMPQPELVERAPLAHPNLPSEPPIVGSRVQGRIAQAIADRKTREAAAARAPLAEPPLMRAPVAADPQTRETLPMFPEPAPEPTTEAPMALDPAQMTVSPAMGPVNSFVPPHSAQPIMPSFGQAPRPMQRPMPTAASEPLVQYPSQRPIAPSRQAKAEAQPVLQFEEKRGPAYERPPLSLLSSAESVERHVLSDEALEENARMLESVLDDYGVKGEIVSVRPGPVVTMYELEPAPGLKASRVIGLADDIARSMSALSARVSTVPGRTVIGIELPNVNREKVVLREILSARDFGDSTQSLPLALGKDIGGAPVIANLAKMPHLLIAGTTGSGKSVAINTMILSLLYKLTPDECRMIMIDPKMLELSVYDGIPHLLSPVVTDPKKAVVALKWVVGEMEERYRKMSKMGVRNIEGYNSRVRDTLARGEMFKRTVQTGFDDATGEPVFETEEIRPETLPYIVVIVDEMADLMMVAGKEIEACIQRLAQMARASGIHLVMATQRPSVDVITGTIKANFPTRISFQVTGKIDSRTILGEQGAEQLLGMGDMLYMAGGSKITRVHGPFVSDEEVEEIVSYLKSFGPPEYVDTVLVGPDDDEASNIDAVLGLGGNTDGEDALYDQAVAIVLRDRKCSTSYIQRKLGIGYNKAARLVEQMEDERVVSAANHVGKREILVPEQ